MPRPIPENKLQEIIAAIGRYADGATAAQIAEALVPGARRTLQYRLCTLVDAGQVQR